MNTIWENTIEPNPHSSRETEGGERCDSLIDPNTSSEDDT